MKRLEKIFEEDDYLFRMRNVKLRLTDLGLYALDCIKSVEQNRFGGPREQPSTSTFNPAGRPTI